MPATLGIPMSDLRGEEHPPLFLTASRYLSHVLVYTSSISSKLIKGEVNCYTTPIFPRSRDRFPPSLGKSAQTVYSHPFCPTQYAACAEQIVLCFLQIPPQFPVGCHEHRCPP